MVPAMDDKTETQAKAGAMIVPVTLFEQNCTIIWHEPSKKAVVIDPGGDVPKISGSDQADRRVSRKDLADARPYRPCRRRG